MAGVIFQSGSYDGTNGRNGCHVNGLGVNRMGSTFGADLKIGRQKGSSSMNIQKSPRFHHRLGLNQPAHSPTARAMAEMATAIGRECGGEYRLEVFPESQLGPDPQMFADVQ